MRKVLFVFLKINHFFFLIDQTIDVLVFEIGNKANIELSKKICLAVLFLLELCFKIVVTAVSLYEFLIILLSNRFFIKLELYPLHTITKLYFKILLLNFTLFNEPEL